MNWDYIAGFLDGEGSIVCTNGVGSYKVTIAQSSKEVLEAIATFLEQYDIYTWISEKPPTELARKPMYYLAFSKSTSVRFFLDAIEDKVIVKRESVKEALRNLTNRTTTPVSKSERATMQSMNAFGYTQREIGNSLGRSQYAVSTNLRRR